MKKLFLCMLIFVLLSAASSFASEGMDYEDMGWALCVKLMENTREAAKENTPDVYEDAYERIQTIASSLPDGKPKDIVFINMDEMTDQLRKNAENALADALVNVKSFATGILSRMDEETAEEIVTAGNALYEKAESVFSVISGEISAFSDSISGNVTEEDMDELEALGEAFADKAFSILGSVLEGAGEYAAGLYERLDEDTQASIDAFVSKAETRLEEIFDEEAFDYLSDALMLTQTYDASLEGANGMYVFDTGAEVFPAVNVYFHTDGTVTMTAMYLDRRTLDMLTDIEALIGEKTN